MLTLTDYLRDPCRSSSLPWWKTAEMTIPDDMLILHDADFHSSILEHYSDDPYFRLLHPMETLQIPKLPSGFEIKPTSFAELSAHINSCYGGTCFTEDTLRSYASHRVYAPDCWLAIADKHTGMIVASGIGELDLTVHEGALEWIQVSSDYQRLGLGRCIVLELLHRMHGRASFVTVSGQCNNPSHPESLYRSCGFLGTGIWHILHRKHC